VSPEVATVLVPAKQAAALVKESLREFGAVRFRVRGHCMRPAIIEGEEVLVADAARRTPRFGDVVLFESAEGLRLHRLVWSVTGFVRTKGDRAQGFDGPGHRQKTLGTVVGVERASGLVPVGSRIRAVTSLLRGIAGRVRRALLAPTRFRAR
jgi:signal peptidase I